MEHAKTPTANRKPSVAKSIFMVMSLLIFVSLGHAFLKFPLQIMLICASVLSAFIAMSCGWTWKELEEGICRRIQQALPVLFIMFTVGLFISCLIFSGSIPMLIYYGLRLINPQYLVVSSFLICAVLSTATGTSWGSAGTAGVALIGVATIMNVPLAPVAGAIVAGATFGDKLSPLSDTTILAALASGTGLYDHVRSMLWTTIPASVISIIIYFVYGLNLGGVGQVPEHIMAMQQALDQMYHWNIMLLIPFVIILLGSLMKKPTLPVMLLASLTAFLMGGLYQGFPLAGGLNAAATGFKVSLIGYDPATVPAEILTLLQRGGMSSMSSIVLTILCAYGFAGIAETSGTLQVCVDWILRKVKSRGATVLAAVCSTILLTIICTVSYISSIIVGEMFRKPYLKHRLDLCNLSRTTEDGGTMISSIIPFSNSGLFYFGALGVSPAVYFPWHFLALLCPIIAIIYGYTGFGLKYLTQEEADAKLEELGLDDNEPEFA